MQRNPTELAKDVRALAGEKELQVYEAFGEVTAEISASCYHEFMQSLRTLDHLAFEELVDLCGVDYAGFGNADEPRPEGRRFAVAVHLLSIEYNCRLRVRVFAPDNGTPTVPSVTDIWPSANWFEREAFDLYGILFSGHPDLRRILTDYGFVGHPFRKDFPVQGYVEMRYDENEKRIVYEPVSIEPREITPRVVRNGQGSGR